MLPHDALKWFGLLPDAKIVLFYISSLYYFTFFLLLTMSVKGMRSVYWEKGDNTDLAETKCVCSETNDTAVKSTARTVLNIDGWSWWLLTVAWTDVLSHSLLVRGGEQEHAGPVTHINLSQQHWDQTAGAIIIPLTSLASVMLNTLLLIHPTDSLRNWYKALVTL